MSGEGLQRTLIIGLGNTGGQVTGRLLHELHEQWGGPGIVQGMAVTSGTLELEKIGSTLNGASAETPAVWQTDFENCIASLLQDISQLHHLPRLRQLGIRLAQANEVHVVVLANLAESWHNTATALIETVRQVVYRTLACEVSFTGLLLCAPPPGDAPEGLSPVCPVEETWAKAHRLAQQFDRGCYLVGLTNDVGLVIGGCEQLVEHAARFLLLLMREAAIAGFDWDAGGTTTTGWGIPLASFGLARVYWPGPDLVLQWSNRWSQTILDELAGLPSACNSADELTRMARQSVQQWLTGAKLAPPLLIETLELTMPPLPNSLPAIVPDPPWPWLLDHVKANLELLARQWQKKWLTMSNRAASTLAEQQQAWPDEAGRWLAQMVASHSTGAVLAAEIYMAAVSELLTTFVEGVEQQVEETTAALIQAEQQSGKLAAELSATISALPHSSVAAVFQWAGRPARWLPVWQQCRHAQNQLRRFAGVSRSWLVTWQRLNVLEMILPFYRQLLADWQPIIGKWQTVCHQVQETEHMLAAASETSSSVVLAEPWQATVVAECYRQTVSDFGDSVGLEVGGLGNWVAAGLNATDIAARLRRQTARFLTPVLDIPADEALCRHVPDPEARRQWLAGFVEQAAPFWQYDEAALTEQSRTRMRLDSWLFLPGGEQSPLAQSVSFDTSPPRIAAGRNRQEIMVTTIRHVNQLISVDESLTDEGEIYADEQV